MRARALVATLTLAALALATAASAHHGEPATGEQELGESLSVTGPEVPDPRSEDGTDTIEFEVSTDDERTPVAKDGAVAGWEQVGGSRWRPDGTVTDLVRESPTPYDLDLYGVGFLEVDVAMTAGLSREEAGRQAQRNGFAVGAQCRRDPGAPEQLVAAEEVAGCERIPVIYRYRRDDFAGIEAWEESYRADDATDPGGFVAAVAWLTPNRALAVGGTGTYPRREQELSDGQIAACRDEALRAQQEHDPSAPPTSAAPASDWAENEASIFSLALAACESKARSVNDLASGAGSARAWLFESGTWREIAGLPSEMAALQALAASPRPTDCGAGVKHECAVAGGMRQLWHFADGRFLRGYGPELGTPAGEGMRDQQVAGINIAPPASPDFFRFRVRDIRFAPNRRGATPEPPDAPLMDYALAVTSGCCSGQRGADHPSVLELRDSGWAAYTRDPYYHPRILTPSGWLNDTAASNAPRFNPDSYYALGVRRTFGGASRLEFAAMRTPGGPPERYEPREPPSRVTGPSTGSGNGSNRIPQCDDEECARSGATQSSVRLLAADGEASYDQVLEWAVGVLRSSGQGIAYSAAGFHCPAPDGGGSRKLCGLTSYGLNGYRVAGEDPVVDEKGIGWAVGDHGAIATRGGALATGEPPPARSAARVTPERVGGGGAFDRHREQVTAEPGALPAIVPGARPAEPGFHEGQIPGGSGSAAGGSGPAELFVISRDGSEGWAFSGPIDYDAFHYDGRRWAPCDRQGIGDLVPPDPACAELPANVTAVARVPLERDADPTNDDEFEAVARACHLASCQGGTEGIYRYRDGRWARDAKLSEGLPTGIIRDIAFTAPDDGWVARMTRVDTNVIALELLHFDGERWVKCTGANADAKACGDDEGRLEVRLPCSMRGPEVHLAVAGTRLYLATIRDTGVRSPIGSGCQSSGGGDSPELYPLMIYRDPGGTWQGGIDKTNDGTYNPTDGGWDPGCVEGSGITCAGTRLPADQGRIDSLSVARNADGSYHGWAVGTFGGTDRESADALMMRLSDGADVPEARDRGEPAWRQWTVPDAANEYLRYVRPLGARPATAQHLTLPSEAGRRSAFLSITGRVETVVWGPLSERGRAPMLGFDQQRGRWAPVATPWSVSPPTRGLRYVLGNVHAIGPDNRGGFWAAVSGHGSGFSFNHYTDRAPAEPFAEAPDPTGGEQRITAMGAGRDGTVWLGDENGGVYRHDRLAGWSGRVELPGWEPPRTTRRTAVSAIAVGPDGSGVAVGNGGRIATLGTEVGLDPAATTACDPQAVRPPCGTGNDLRAAALAPDGAAIVAGQNRTLLWRPASGGFRTIEGPPVPRATSIAEVSMPRPDRAYLLTETPVGAASRVIAGEMSAPGQWSWRIEVGDSGGAPDPLTDSGSAFGVGRTIRDLAVDATGRGYAVGDSGMILAREGEGRWRRVPWPDRSNLLSVALPEGGGEAALIGGEGGRILTLNGGRWEVARHAVPFDPVVGGIAELALTPGYGAGEVEAWAVRDSTLIGSSLAPVSHVMHHPAEPADPRLDPARGLAALGDAPAPTPGELSFAAFGKQECDAINSLRSGGFATSFLGGSGLRDTCGPPDGANVTADLISRKIREELVSRSQDGAGPWLALFTGDAVDKPGGRETQGSGHVPGVQHRTPLDLNLKHRRWVELVADPLAERGLATFGAIGGQDLAGDVEQCHAGTTSSAFQQNTGSGCAAPSQAGAGQLGVRAGLNLPWRGTMASAPAPWEREQAAGGLRFERVGAGALSQRGPEASTPDLSVGDVDAFGPSARTEGRDLDAGDTHYAVDVIDEVTDEKVARIVVVDTSMGSIAASDPQQHPIEAGGQLRWLEEVLCFEGSAEDTDGDVRDCTREEGQQAIVLSNTPTYSYGPISPDETQADAAAFEAVLLKNQVNVVVSGRLGWNGRYWAVAPGVHAPCPGQDYRSDSEAPSIGQPEICGASAVGGTQDVVPDPNQIIQGLPEEAKQAAGFAGRGAIPFVVSSTAGGRFNEKAVRGGFATADRGFWRGYSIVRLHPSGDPAKTIVEQRPILDWVGLSANDPVLAPGGRLQLQSFAREAFGMDTAPRYYEIPETQVITHRYHLLLADPEEPWRACEAGDSECEAVHEKLSTGVSGLALQQRAAATQDLTPSEGAGDNPCDPYLCLPERIGTIDPDTGEVRAGNGKYPDTFALATLSVGEHVAAQPLVFTKSSSFVLSAFAQPPELPSPGANLAYAPTAPAPPPTPKPPIPQVNTPEPPLPPAVPPIAATQPPEPQPPAPPAPPPPTDQPSPLNLTLAPPGITVATPTAVIQPPTPPVNPAPPGGARREARQRQAAAQKSGADSEEAGEEGGGDLANKPPTAFGTSAMRRRERTRPEPSFTPIARADQPSAWAQGLLYSGGLTLIAAALALGWTGVHPTPRRRAPETPAPAYARLRRPW